MKTYLQTLFSITISLLSFACSPQMGDDDALTINERVFSRDDFFADVDETKFAGFNSSQREKVVEEFANRHIILMEAEKRGLLEDIRIQKAESQLRENLIVDRIIDKEIWQLVLSDSSLRILYDRMGKEISVHHILVTYGGSLQSKSDRREKEALYVIREIQQKIINGEIKFFEAAKKYSECPSKFDDGVLGRFKWGELFEPVQSVAFSMGVGEISEPFQSDFGYHIVRVTGIKKVPLASYEDMIPKLKIFIRGRQGHEFDVALQDFESMLQRRYAVRFLKDEIRRVKFEVIRIHGDKEGTPTVGEIPKVKFNEIVCVAGGVPVALEWFKGKISLLGSPLTESIVVSEKSLITALEHVLYRFLTTKYAEETRDEEWLYTIDKRVQHKRVGVLKKILIEELSQNNPDVPAKKLIQQISDGYKVRFNRDFILSYVPSPEPV